MSLATSSAVEPCSLALFSFCFRISIVYSCRAPCWFVPTHFLTVLSSLIGRVHIICIRLTHRHECTSQASRADTRVLRVFLDDRFPLFTENLEISFHFMSDGTSGGKLSTYDNNEQSHSNLLRNLPVGELCTRSADLVTPSLPSLSPDFTHCSLNIPPLVYYLSCGDCLM